MRSSHVRSLTASAVLATSLASVLAGVGTAQAASTGPAAAAGPSNSALTISNGTSTLTVAGQPVAFGSAVTDAAWSPDGSRVAFIDGNGNLVNAAPDGSDPIVLTTAAAGTVRAHPIWEDGGLEIVFTETVGSAVSKLMSVDAAGLTLGQPSVERPLGETASDTTADSNADAYFDNTPVGNSPFGHPSRLVYQHETAQGSEIWILDRNTRGPSGSRLVAGQDPVISPDGRKVAFTDDVHRQIETVDLPILNNAPVITAITTSTTMHYTHPTWSPDGKTLAFEGMMPGVAPAVDTAKDVETTAATGGTAPTVVQTTPGVPAYQPLNQHHVNRIAGGDRLSTAIAASNAAWATNGGSQSNDPRSNAGSAVLSRSDQFADALGGSALANSINGPLLLTPTAGLAAAVQNELIRVLGVPNAQNPQTVYLLGGEQALSPAVFNTIAALGYHPVRLGGADRYATSIAIATQMTTNTDGTVHQPTRIMVATGVNFPDALSAGAAANSNGEGVVILTQNKVMPAATAAFLNRFTYGGQGGVSAYAIGGQADGALRSVGFGPNGRPYTPIYGPDRYATSLLVAKTFFDGPSKVGFATSLNWADALSGGALMGHVNAPLILVEPNSGPSADTTAWLKHTGPQLTNAYILGGNGAVTAGVDPLVGAAISGVAGFDQGTNPINVTY